MVEVTPPPDSPVSLPRRHKRHCKLSASLALAAIVIIAGGGVAFWRLHESPTQRLIAQLQTRIQRDNNAQTKALDDENLAQVCLSAQQLSCAQTAAADAEKLAPDNPGVLLQLAQTYASTGNKTAALKYYEAARAYYDNGSLLPNDPTLAAINKQINQLEQ